MQELTLIVNNHRLSDFWYSEMSLDRFLAIDGNKEVPEFTALRRLPSQEEWAAAYRRFIARYGE